MQKSGNPKNILIAGGGTGGHLYPALAIARAMLRQDPGVCIHFVGTRSGLEKDIIPREKFPLHFISIGKLNSVSLFEKIKTVLGLPLAVLQSVRLLFQLRPQAVLGVGGYASAPVVMIASLLGFRTALWEPNAKPGMANRWLSRFVKKSFFVFPEAEKELLSPERLAFGLPVRSEIIAAKNASGATDEFRVLVFGGSQGARAISQSVVGLLKNFPADKKFKIKFILQTGMREFEIFKKELTGISNVEVLAFLHDMPKYYSWADLVICRSGASTVAELAAVGKAAILIPFPGAADQHQLKNAVSLVAKDAAVLIEQKDLSPQILLDKILYYFDHRGELKRLEKNICQFYQPQSAEKISANLLNRKV